MTRPAPARLAALALLAIGLCGHGRAQAADRVIWQIGTQDGSYREFAIAGRYADYKRAFPHDVTYRIGRSTPARDWPFIGPGPSDPWADQRLHPFAIEFNLAAVPTTPCRLEVCLVDGRHEAPQVLEVAINGRRTYAYDVVAGTGEESLTSPAAGRQSVIPVVFQPSLLHPGRNRITLTVAKASWILYDSISLATGPGIPNGPVLADVIATRMPGTNGSPGMILVALANFGTEGALAVGLPGNTRPGRALRVQPGRNTFSIPLASGANDAGGRLQLCSGGHTITVPIQAPAVLWRIGQPDSNFREFAIAGHYPDYAARFPRDVTYRVDRDQPARSWPFIHPGPNDSWAGTHPHPFRILFPLASAPAGSVRLNLDVVDTQPLGGPVLQVDINGRGHYQLQLPTGGSDSSLVDATRGRHCKLAVGIAARMLHAGANTITLTIISGSWLTYDALSLESGVGLPNGPRIEATSASATPLFRRVSGRLRQMVRVLVRNTGVEGNVRVSLQGPRGPAIKASIAPGENHIDVPADPLAAPVPAIAVVSDGSHKAEARFVAMPQKRWKVFVGPSTHTDIGYTDWQERVYDTHAGNTARAIAECAKSPDFKWNMEVGFQADIHRLRDTQINPDLLARIREGRIGLGGLYLNMLTGLCSGEELVRCATFVQDTARKAGTTALAANLTDVPTAVGTLPMILAQAGERYFADGANDYIPFGGGGRPIDQSPYWWEGLDGSRVLAITTRQYAQAGTLGMNDDVATMEKRLPAWLMHVGRDPYPGDAAYVFGAFSDNQPMNPRFARTAAEWNARWEYPRIIIGRVDEFFQYVEKQSGQRLPVFRGDFGVKWEDGAGSSALETAMVRRAKARLEASERWQALTEMGVKVGLGDLSELWWWAWQRVLLYDEHTWGAASSVTDPEGEQTRHQWQVKAGFARSAVQEADRLMRAGILGTVLAPRSDDDARDLFAVANEHSWPRDIVATFPLPDGFTAATVTDESRAHLPVPCQVEGRNVVFLARQVPPFGHRLYRVTGDTTVGQARFLTRGADEWTWETPDFQLRIDGATGALSSLRDKRSGTEWVRPGSGFGMDQFVYVTGPNVPGMANPATPMSVHTHSSASVSVEQDGPLRAILHITRTGPAAPPTDTYLVLGPGRRIEFVNVVHKAPTLTKEAGYFAFPFPVSSPSAGRAFVELPYGVMQVEKDQAPGGCRDWFATNSFAAVSDGRLTALVATPHTPMLTVNDIIRGTHTEKIESINGSLFAYAFNNCWDTNYKASQGGDMLFSFSLGLQSGAFDPVAATRFGWEALSAMADPEAAGQGRPIAVSQVPAWPAGKENRPEQSLLQVSGDGIVVGGLTLKDKELQVRLYNPSSQASTATVAVPGRRIIGAVTADLNGEPIAQLPVAPGAASVQVQVRARSLATVVIDVEAKPLSIPKGLLERLQRPQSQ